MSERRPIKIPLASILAILPLVAAAVALGGWLFSAGRVSEKMLTREQATAAIERALEKHQLAEHRGTVKPSRIARIETLLEGLGREQQRLMKRIDRFIDHFLERAKRGGKIK